MNDPHWWGTATTLLDGRVLVTAGGGVSGPQRVMRVYLIQLLAHGLTLVDSTLRRLLQLRRFSQTAEFWLPGVKIISITRSARRRFGFLPPAFGRSSAGYSEPRARHTAARLPDGRVLVAGGEDYQGSGTLASTEIFDPATSAWTTTADLVTGREQHATATLLDGTVMVAGGYAPSGEGLGKRRVV